MISSFTVISGSILRQFHLSNKAQYQMISRRTFRSLRLFSSPMQFTRYYYSCQSSLKTSRCLQQWFQQSSRDYGCWSSSRGDNIPTLRTIEDVAKFIKERSSNILVMVGAGISTPSGIPDFRSPGSGLYDNLQKYNLPYPEAIFDIHFFMMDPRPFFTFAQDLLPGVNYKPNEAHHFLRLLHDEEKLLMVYTQNIDGLERLAGIPDTKLVEAHGSFATASCTLCGKMHNANKVKQAILDGGIPVMCEARKCKGKVKPDIVFFGENLPQSFWDYHQYIPFTDLLLVIGTSLEVYPFAGIADAVGTMTPRVLINLNTVGSFGSRTSDVILTGDLRENVLNLAKALGWEEKLKNLKQEYEKKCNNEE